MIPGKLYSNNTNLYPYEPNSKRDVFVSENKILLFLKYIPYGPFGDSTYKTCVFLFESKIVIANLTDSYIKYQLQAL